ATLSRAVGTSGGAVMVELEWGDGRRTSRALVATESGQRMAAVPCAVVAHAPGAGAVSAVGGGSRAAPARGRGFAVRRAPPDRGRPRRRSAASAGGDRAARGARYRANGAGG